MKKHVFIMACLLVAGGVKKNTPGPDAESTRIDNPLTTQEFTGKSIPEGMYAKITDAADGGTIAVLSPPPRCCSTNPQLLPSATSTP